VNRRELILQRLFDLGQGLDGIASAYRDHGPTETGVLGVARPAFLLYDGGTRMVQDIARHKSPVVPPLIFRMEPQFVILLQPRDTVENVMLHGTIDPVGMEASDWMDVAYSAVINDPALIDLVTPNGMHFISAVDTDLKLGQSVGVLGGAWLLFSCVFEYPWFPSR
jgi:hypothetical protein